MNYKNIAIIAIVILLGAGIAYAYNAHATDIRTLKDRQTAYPYHCVVSDAQWDECTTDTPNGTVFADTQQCVYLYYWVMNWGSSSVTTIDSDGVSHYKRQVYDSNNVWHESSEWQTC